MPETAVLVANFDISEGDLTTELLPISQYTREQVSAAIGYTVCDACTTHEYCREMKSCSN